jgi:hypothetical protein
MKKELYIFIGIFLFLAIGMHFKEWISSPLDHIASLPHAMAYGMGALHPLIFTVVVYILFTIFRSIVRLIKRTINR